MKKLLAAIMFLAIAGCSNEPPLDVLGMKQDVTKYTKGSVTMEGIVSTWQSRDKSQFGIVDIKESGQKTQFLVPVRYVGERPAPGTKVQVTGTASMHAREFQATKVVVVK